LLAAQTSTAGAIAEQFDGARSTVSKHIQILVECGLVEPAHKGMEIHYQIKMEKLDEINIWMSELRKIWDERFDRLDACLEKIQNIKK
jgi:predicted transcriptional regulator